MNSSKLKIAILIVISNTILLIATIILVYLLVTNSEQLEYEVFKVDPQFFGIFRNMLLITGVLVCFVCILTFAAIFKNKAFHFLMCAVMFTVLAIIEIATVLLLYPDKGKLKNGLETRWFEIMLYREEMNIIYDFQETHKCCGWNSYNDWEMNIIPGSCCEKPWYEICTDENYLKKISGCKTIVDKYLRNILTYLPYILPLVFVFEIILIVALFSVIIADFENDYLANNINSPRSQLTPHTRGVTFEESANTHSNLEDNSSVELSGDSPVHIEINFIETAL